MFIRIGRGLAWLWLAGALIAAAAVGCREQGSTSGSHTELTVERSYELHCLGCHGAKGEGAWGSNIQGLKTSIEEITRVIAEGEGKMPGYRDHLSEAEMRELAVYVKAFK